MPLSYLFLAIGGMTNGLMAQFGAGGNERVDSANGKPVFRFGWHFFPAVLYRVKRSTFANPIR